MTRQPLRAFPYGFVLTEGPHEAPTPEFGQMHLPGGHLYSFHRHSPGQVAVDGEDFAIVHGHATSVRPETSTEQLAVALLEAHRAGESDLLTALSGLGGRHVVIAGGRGGVQIYPDLHGCRSIYYATDRPVVASHAALVPEASGEPAKRLTLAHRQLGMLWDASPYPRVKALLPNHRLTVADRRPERFWPREPNPFASVPAQQRVELIESAWLAQMDHYATHRPGMIMSLSGGSDSRVALALAKKYLAKIEFFTYTTTASRDDYWGNTVTQDARIVRQIVTDLGIRHRLIDAAKERPLAPEDRRTLARNTIGAHGFWLLPHYRHHFPGDHRLHLRGNLLETGRSAYLRHDKPATPDALSDFIFQGLRSTVPADKMQDAELRKSIDKGIETFGYGGDLHGYHPVDVHKIEVRSGRWFSELLNESDAAFDSLMPFNVRTMIEASLAWPQEERVRGDLFYELVNRNFPVLNFYGRNDERNLYEQTRP